MTNKNTFDGLRFRILEVLSAAKNIPLTAVEITDRLRERDYGDILRDTVIHKVMGAMTALRNKGEVTLHDAKDAQGRPTYVMPQRLAFPPRTDVKPANPVLTPEMAAKITAAQPKKEVAMIHRTMGMRDALLSVLDEAKRPMSVVEITEALKALGFTGNTKSAINNAITAGVAQKRPTKRKGLRMVYFTDKTGPALKQIEPNTAPIAPRAPVEKTFVNRRGESITVTTAPPGETLPPWVGATPTKVVVPDAPEKVLGKIVKAVFGFGGGGADTALGATFELTFGGTNSQWFTPVDGIAEIMRAAKVEDFARMTGKPIEVTCDFNTVKSWRILTEVL